MDKKYRFDCPMCGIERYYSHSSPYCRAVRLNTPCRPCGNNTVELRRIRSKNVKGKRNHFSRDVYIGKDNQFYGKTHTEESKRKMRVVVARAVRDKYGVCLDNGANEWFAMLNKLGFTFEEGYLIEPLGYFADGYDRNKHTWVEYDTPYHNKPSQKKKDLDRQQRIIRYYESIGNPLAQFFRYNTTTKTLKKVYRGKNWMEHLYGYNYKQTLPKNSTCVV